MQFGNDMQHYGHHRLVVMMLIMIALYLSTLNRHQQSTMSAVVGFSQRVPQLRENLFDCKHEATLRALLCSLVVLCVCMS